MQALRNKSTAFTGQRAGKGSSTLIGSRVGRSSQQVVAALASQSRLSAKQAAITSIGATANLQRRSLLLGLLASSSSQLPNSRSMAAAAVGCSGSHDLLVVGPGVLGGYAGQLWAQAHPGAAVVGLTNTTNNHEKLKKQGLTPATKDTLEAGRKFPYVIFSAPPSGSQDYAAEVSAALSRWDSSAPSASFVFTSSMGVCSEDNGGLVREDCPLVDPEKSPSQGRIIAAEKRVIEAGGNVVRLVGLYHLTRGAHTFFLRTKDVQRPGDYVVNLIHYEDAARIAVAILGGEGSGPFRGRVFLGCDNNPVTFRDMIAACLTNPHFAGQGPVNWLVPDGQGPRGKRTDNSVSRDMLGGWAPKYESFQAFMDTAQHGGKDVYNP